MKKRTGGHIEDGDRREPEEAEAEEATAEVQSDEDFAREDLKRWLAMIADIYSRGGHIDAVAYASGHGSMHVQFGACAAVEKDPPAFLRWLAEGLVPSEGPSGAEATRH